MAPDCLDPGQDGTLKISVWLTEKKICDFIAINCVLLHLCDGAHLPCIRQEGVNARLWAAEAMPPSPYWVCSSCTSVKESSLAQSGGGVGGEGCVPGAPAEDGLQPVSEGSGDVDHNLGPPAAHGATGSG